MSSPTFSVVAIATLALGIGANTAMFGIINEVLLRPLQFPEPEQLVMIQRLDLQDGTTGGNTTPANFFAWQARSSSFSAMAVLNGDIAALIGAEETRRVAGVRSAGSLLEVLDVAPLFGRGLTTADDDADDAVVVLSHQFWQSVFGDDRDVLGRTILLDNVAHTIVGVMPPDFEYRYYANLDVDFWGTSGWTPEYRQNRTNYAHEVIARLAPGVSVERAGEEMDAIAAALREEYPEANRNHGIHIEPLQEYLVADVNALLLTLMGCVGVVLLIATVNLANLLLARAGSRESEILVRQAIGATPLRLARQLMTESLLLALIGGAAGLLLGYLFTDLVATFIPGELPNLERAGVDLQVFWFALGVAVAAGLLFGSVPALRLSRQAASGPRGTRASARTSWTWSALVVAEVALSVVLLIGAGLLLRTFVNLATVDPGFRTDRVMTFTVALPNGYVPERRVAFWEELRRELEALPGVTDAAVSNQLPAEPNRVSGWFNFVDQPVDNSDRSYLVPYRLVSPGYFETLAIPLTAGRSFAELDSTENPPAVINEAARRRFWGDADPLGDRVGIGDREGGLFFPAATVVGVVADVRNEGLNADSVPSVYFPAAFATGWTNMTLAVRTAGEPTAILGAARDRVRRLEPAATVFNEITVAQMLAAQIAPTRSILQLLGSFAVLGLGMAAIGVFGVLSYSVSRRTREIGIRTALGANAYSLTSMVVSHAMVRVLAGTALGIVMSLGTARFLAGMLYGVSTVDPLTILGVAALLGLVALLASYVPARRATRIHPVEALRYE